MLERPHVMSKFIEQLNNTHQSSTPRLGFGTSRDDTPPNHLPLIIVTDVTSPKTLEKLKNLKIAGVIFTQSAQAKAGKDLAKARDTIDPVPTGLWHQTSSPNNNPRKIEGWDFGILDINSPSSLVSEVKDYGQLLEIDPDIEETLIRGLDALPIGGLFYACDSEILTIRHLLSIHRLGQLTTKPVLVLVSPQVNEKNLELLIESGASGVAIELKDGSNNIETIQHVQDILSKLPVKKNRSRRMDAIISYQTPVPEGEPTRVAPDPDEPEEDDY